MEIHRITDQGPETLQKYYRSNRWRHWREEVNGILTVLDELERADHPPVWAFTSLTTLYFNDRDSRDWLVEIEPNPVRRTQTLQFRVRYTVPLPEFYEIAFANNPADAAQLVIKGLRLASRANRPNIGRE